jgi:hypothetical protein
MLVLIYEGDMSDPSNQRVRLVEEKSLKAARAKYPHAAVGKYERPRLQGGPDIEALKQGIPVIQHGR